MPYINAHGNESERRNSLIHNEKKAAIEHYEIAAGSYELPVPEYQTNTIAKTVRVFWRLTLLAVGLGIGAPFDCFAIIVPNNIVANAGFICDFGRNYNAEGVPIAMAPKDLSNWNLATSLGAILGLAIAGILDDRFGRKVVLYVYTIMLIIATVLSVTLKPGFAGWIVRAIFTGMSQGLLQGSLAPYLTEIAPPNIRGMFLYMYRFFWGLGILVNSIALFVCEQIDLFDWKGAFYARSVLLGLFLPALFLSPETPWFLARKESKVQAERVMRFLYGNVPS